MYAFRHGGVPTVRTLDAHLPAVYTFRHARVPTVHTRGNATARRVHSSSQTGPHRAHKRPVSVHGAGSPVQESAHGGGVVCRVRFPSLLVPTVYIPGTVPSTVYTFRNGRASPCTQTALKRIRSGRGRFCDREPFDPPRQFTVTKTSRPRSLWPRRRRATSGGKEVARACAASRASAASGGKKGVHACAASRARAAKAQLEALRRHALPQP